MTAANVDSAAFVLVEGLYIELVLLLTYTSTVKLADGISHNNREATHCSNGQMFAGWLALSGVFMIALFRHTIRGYVPGGFRWRMLRLSLFTAVLSSTHCRPIACSMDEKYLYVLGYIQGAIACILALSGWLFLFRRVSWKQVCCARLTAIIAPTDDGDDESTLTRAAHSTRTTGGTTTFRSYSNTSLPERGDCQSLMREGSSSSRRAPATNGGSSTFPYRPPPDRNEGHMQELNSEQDRSWHVRAEHDVDPRSPIHRSMTLASVTSDQY